MLPRTMLLGRETMGVLKRHLRLEAADGMTTSRATRLQTKRQLEIPEGTG